MASSIATPAYVAEAASACTGAAVEIQKLLARLRSHVLSLEAHRLGVTPARFQALMIGYDIYAQMLDDALTDIASRLTSESRMPFDPARAEECE